MDDSKQAIVDELSARNDVEDSEENIFLGMYNLKTEIRELSSTGIPISKLDPISNDVSGLLSTDYFTISKPHAVETVMTGQKSTEYNIRYGVLRTTLLSDFKAYEHSTVNTRMLGTWTFGTKNQSRIRAATSAITGNDKIGRFDISSDFPKLDAGVFQNNYSVITLAFFRNRLLPIIDRLSSIYYNTRDKLFTYPTRRGDVETMFKRGVGNLPPANLFSTSWSSICKDGKDRLLIGEGSCEANNFLRYGNCAAGDMDKYTNGRPAGYIAGEDKVLIETKHYPQHKHKIECSTVSYKMSFHLRGTAATLCCTGVTNNYQHGGGMQHRATTGTITPFKMTGSVTFSTAGSYGSSIRIHDQIYNSSGERVRASKNSSHNNIPPVIILKIIKRDR